MLHGLKKVLEWFDTSNLLSDTIFQTFHGLYAILDGLHAVLFGLLQVRQRRLLCPSLKCPLKVTEH